MYAIKIIHLFDKNGRQQQKLLAGEEVIYEMGSFKDKDGFYSETGKIVGESTNYTFHASEQKKVKEVQTFVAISLFSNNEWHRHIVCDAWVYIMLNGKTVDKIEVI
jgi:hypothetical protein